VAKLGFELRSADPGPRCTVVASRPHRAAGAFRRNTVLCTRRPVGRDRCGQMAGPHPQVGAGGIVKWLSGRVPAPSSLPQCPNVPLLQSGVGLPWAALLAISHLKSSISPSPSWEQLFKAAAAPGPESLAGPAAQAGQCGCSRTAATAGSLPQTSCNQLERLGTQIPHSSLPLMITGINQPELLPQGTLI
jgi:hypothetical protein